MPIAELHGKSGPEDTLTSGVFGLLTLLPSWCLCGWFAKAERLEGMTLAVPNPASIEADFWPQLDDGVGSCEPDALLSFTGVDGKALGVLVEVKYKSGMSGWPTPPDEDDRIRGQLGREWAALGSTPAHTFPGKPFELHRRVLVYVTTGATMPSHEFDCAAKELEHKGGDSAGFRSSAYWVSWFALTEIVRDALDSPVLPHVERIGLVRLHELLKARRLSAFSRIDAPKAVPRIAWQYGPRPSVYPSTPTPHAGP